MSKSLQVFICPNCNKRICIIEQNIHKIKCKQFLININKKSFPHTQKISKTNNNRQNYSIIT